MGCPRMPTRRVDSRIENDRPEGGRLSQFIEYLHVRDQALLEPLGGPIPAVCLWKSLMPVSSNTSVSPRPEAIAL